MLGVAASVATRLRSQAQQAVVPHVADDLQQAEPEHRLDHQERDHRKPEPRNGDREQCHGDRPGVQHVVAGAQHMTTLGPQALGLEVPGRGQTAEHGAREGGPEALAHARTGRVFGRGHPAVVSAVEFDMEVAVRVLGDHELREAPSTFSWSWPSSWALSMPNPATTPMLTAMPRLTNWLSIGGADRRRR